MIQILLASRRTAAAPLVLLGAVALLTGCASRSAAPGTVIQIKMPAPVVQNEAALTPAQKQQQRDQITQFVQKLTPAQKAAYFKAHPEALKALTP